MFGEIVDKKMVLNHAGNMIQTVWDEIPFHYAGIEIDEFTVMPNHIHGIIVIVAVGATPVVALMYQGRHRGLPLRGIWEIREHCHWVIWCIDSKP